MVLYTSARMLCVLVGALNGAAADFGPTAPDGRRPLRLQQQDLEQSNEQHRATRRMKAAAAHQKAVTSLLAQTNGVDSDSVWSDMESRVREAVAREAKKPQPSPEPEDPTLIEWNKQRKAIEDGAEAATKASEDAVANDAVSVGKSADSAHSSDKDAMKEINAANEQALTKQTDKVKKANQENAAKSKDSLAEQKANIAKQKADIEAMEGLAKDDDAELAAQKAKLGEAMAKQKEQNEKMRDALASGSADAKETAAKQKEVADEAAKVAKAALDKSSAVAKAALDSNAEKQNKVHPLSRHTPLARCTPLLAALPDHATPSLPPSPTSTPTLTLTLTLTLTRRPRR